MTKPWDLVLIVDAIGHDDAQVRVAPTGDGRPHVQVRTGTLLAHCLDGPSVNSIASAWAAAQVRVGPWLPAQPPPRRTPSPEVGTAYPVGSVIFEGRQPWSVSTTANGLTVVMGCVQVEVHDRSALEVHLRAWNEASAHATRVFPGRALPYRELVRQAQGRLTRSAAGEASSPTSRREGRPTR